MLRIYLIRHGQTVFNTQDICQGWNDSPLTELGMYQPKCAGYGLKDSKFIKAYSGDTQRQIDTAKQFLLDNKYPTEIIPDMHFREMCYGKNQGKNYKLMLEPLFIKRGKQYAGYPGLYEFMDDYQIAKEIYENDETGQTEGPDKSCDRFLQGLDMITKENSEGNILISTSSAVIAFVLRKLFPDFIQGGLVDNASITILGYEDGKYTLQEFNNITYRKIGEEHYKSL